MKLLFLFVGYLFLAGSWMDGKGSIEKSNGDKIDEMKSGISEGRIEIEGVYKGKNLYVQNPLLDPEKEYGFCVTKVPVVNGHISQRLIKSSSFEIDLSHLKSGDKVHIVIEHGSDCTPKILNLEAVDGVVK